MGVRQPVYEQVDVVVNKNDFHVEGIGQKELELLESNLGHLERVESLARVCSLSKASPIVSRGSLSSELEETSSDEEQSDPPSPKKLKDNRESPVPVESSNNDLDMQAISVGIYTRAERQAKLERYRAKKNRRTFNKKILYACRKSFADSRPRVGGRFIPLKDLQVPSLSPTLSSNQRTEKEFSELLASISADLAHHTAPSSRKQSPRLDSSIGRHSPSSPTQTYHPVSPPCCNSSPVAFSQQIPFSSLSNYSSPHSYHEFNSSTSLPPQYMHPQQNSFYSPVMQQPAYLYSRSLSCPYSSPLSLYSSTSSFSSVPLDRRTSHVRPSIDEPSASLLLLSLASSTASRAEVF